MINRQYYRRPLLPPDIIHRVNQIDPIGVLINIVGFVFDVQNQISCLDPSPLGRISGQRRHHRQGLVYKPQLNPYTGKFSGEILLASLVLSRREKGSIGVIQSRRHSGNCSIHHLLGIQHLLV